MDEIRLESYSKALVEEFADDADTITVLERLSNTSRAEFEPIIPAKPDLIRMVRNEDWRRRREAREARNREEERICVEQIEAERKAGTFEHLDIDGAIKAAMAAKERKAVEDAVSRAYKPTVEQTCLHCGPQSPTDSVSLYRLARMYTQKAERAEDREKKLGEVTNPTV